MGHIDTCSSNDFGVEVKDGLSQERVIEEHVGVLFKLRVATLLLAKLGNVCAGELQFAVEAQVTKNIKFHTRDKVFKLLS